MSIVGAPSQVETADLVPLSVTTLSRRERSELLNRLRETTSNLEARDAKAVAEGRMDPPTEQQKRTIRHNAAHDAINGWRASLTYSQIELVRDTWADRGRLPSARDLEAAR